MKIPRKLVWLCLLLIFGCSLGADKSQSIDKKGELYYLQKLSSSVANKYRMYRLFMAPEKARQKTVEWARKQEKVKNAGVSADNQTIYVILENGMEICFITRSK